MKNDALKNLVESRRDQFDDRHPSANVWDRISRNLFGGKHVTLWNSVSLWRAAAIVLFGLSSFLFYTRAGEPLVSKPQITQQEFSDIETFYASQISEKSRWISSEGRFADDTFTQDLQKLEAMYSVLSDELKKQPSERVKDALVLNMLVRLDLLNQQIQKLEESKRSQPKEATI